MSRFLILAFLIAVTMLLACDWFGLAMFSPPTQGGDKFKPGMLPEDAVAKLQPGLTLRFGKDGSTDARGIRLAALHVPEGFPHSTMLAAGRFSATLSGFLKESLNSECRFKLVGTGDAELFVNDKSIATLKDGGGKESGLIDIVQGYNKFVVHYASPATGDATVRVYWSSEEFSWEPIPPEQLFTRGDDAGLEAGTNFREGRLLFATHGCIQCHGLPGKITPEQCRMPELKQQAPSLENVGNRLAPSWMATWIANPDGHRPEAMMPRLLEGDNATQDAADLAAYLASLKMGQPFSASKKTEELTEVGEKLFVSLGCVSCHHFQAPPAKDEYNRLSLFAVGVKFVPGGLPAFLRSPHQHYAWSRMPDFKLTGDEAAALTSYLLSEAKGESVPWAREGDAKRGQKLFSTIGCAQCHVTESKATLPKAISGFPRDLAKGCLAGDAGGRGKAPQFHFTPAERAGLRAFLATDGSSLTRETPAEFSMRQIKLLQCNSCHTRDAVPSRWYNVMTLEFARDPEYLPHLTWTGEKLHPEWTRKLLAGEHEHRARPWLRARMPAFPTRAAMLSFGISHENGYGVKEDPRPKPDAALAKIGNTLLPQNGGFNCVQCHSVGNQKAVEPFDAEGINLLDAALRLRYDFYIRWMMDPARVDKTTRMTKFTEEGGRKTKIAEVLDGDARRQFDAIWHAIQALTGKEK